MSTRFVMSALLVAACGGGSDLDPGAGDNPGEGTSTLMVDGSAHASPRIMNAQSRGDYDTYFSVRVQQNQQTISTAIVTVTSSSGTFELQFSPDGNRYYGTAAGYDEVYILDVESGPDYARDIRVDGPDIHRFTKPLAGATVDSTQPLEIQWDSDQTADSAALRGEEIDDIAMPDTGEYMLAAGGIRADRETPRENELRIRRENRVTPASTIGGSEWSVAIDNHLEVIAQPNPAL